MKFYCLMIDMEIVRYEPRNEPPTSFDILDVWKYLIEKPSNYAENKRNQIQDKHLNIIYCCTG